MNQRKGGTDEIFILGLLLLVIIAVILVPNMNKETEEQKMKREMRSVPVKDSTLQAGEKSSNRFSAEFVGEFNGGYENNIRQIFILTDSKNGKQYLTITGCGTTEIHVERHDDNSRSVEE